MSSVSRPERMRSALTALERMPSAPWSSAYWRDQEQRRRLGQAIGAEIGAGVHRLLRGVEQQAAAQALRAHDAHGVLRHALVRPEIELEALAQGRLVDRRRSCPARPRRRWRRRCRRRRRSRRPCRRPRAPRPALVTSQAMAKPLTLETSRSSTTTSAPSRAKAAAVAAPMPEAPPVTTAMRRASGFSAAALSLACSSDQYSMSKMSGSGMHL